MLPPKRRSAHPRFDKLYNKHKHTAISPDGNYFASQRGNCLNVWDTRNGHILHTMKSGFDYPFSLEFSANGIFAWNVGQYTYFLDLLTKDTLNVTLEHNLQCDCFAFSPDGSMFAMARVYGWGREWPTIWIGSFVSFDDFHLKVEIPNISRYSRVESIALSPDSRYLGYSIFDRVDKVVVHDLKRDPYYPIGIWEMKGRRIEKILFLPDGKCLAAIGMDQDISTPNRHVTELKVWEIHSRREIYSKKFKGRNRIACCSMNDQFVIATDSPSRLHRFQNWLQ